MRAFEWLMFSVGGTLAAFIAIPLLFYIGIAVPLGMVPQETLAFDHWREFLHHPVIALTVAGTIILIGAHGAHRTGIIFCDLDIPGGVIVERYLHAAILACGIIAYIALIA